MKKLTQRETQLLKLLRRGLSDREIAEAARLTHGTTRQYLHTLYQKIKVKNRTAAAEWYSKQEKA